MVNRDFFLMCMVQIGFPPLFIFYIKACINDILFFICLNGSLQGFFCSTNSLCQGWPFSPLIFYIIIDAFSCLLNYKSQPSSFQVIPINKWSISHMLFMDDVMIFGLVSMYNITNLEKHPQHFSCLYWFEGQSFQE